jgi:hypothetical protein
MEPMGSEIAVPLEAFELDDDGKTVSPEVGQPVEFNATGTISRVENGTAYLTLESVNDVPVTPPAAEPMADDADAMRSLGAQVDASADDDETLYS